MASNGDMIEEKKHIFSSLSYWQRQRMLTVFDLLLGQSKSGADASTGGNSIISAVFPAGSIEKAYVDKAYETLADASSRAGLKLRVMGAAGGGVQVELAGDGVAGGSLEGVTLARQVLVDSLRIVSVGGGEAAGDAPDLLKGAHSIYQSIVEGFEGAAAAGKPELDLPKIIALLKEFEFSVVSPLPTPVVGSSTKIKVANSSTVGTTKIELEVEIWDGSIDLLYHFAAEIPRRVVAALLQHIGGHDQEKSPEQFTGYCDEWANIILAAAVSGQRRRVENVTLKVPLTVLEQQAVYWTTIGAGGHQQRQAVAFLKRRLFVESPELIPRPELEEPKEGETEEEEDARFALLMRKPPTYQGLTVRFMQGLSSPALLDLGDL